MFLISLKFSSSRSPSALSQLLVPVRLTWLRKQTVNIKLSDHNKEEDKLLEIRLRIEGKAETETDLLRI